MFNVRQQRTFACLMTESMTVTDSLVKGMYVSFNSHEWRISSALFVDPEKSTTSSISVEYKPPAWREYRLHKI